MKFRKILNGIAALFFVAAILLFSDRSNRTAVKKINDSAKGETLRFCFVKYSESAISEDTEKGVRYELQQQGLVENRDFTLKLFSAQGDMATLNSIAETVAGKKWDLIFISSTPTVQVFAKKVTHSPVVFTNTGDPIGAGVGESFEKHLPNLTGICTTSDFDGMVNLVTETIPGIKSIGTIYAPGEINSVKYAEELKKAAAKKGLNLITVPANTVTEVADAAMVITSQKPGAITQISDNLSASCSETILKETNKAQIPYFSFISKQTEKGAVAALARDYFQAGCDAVMLGMQILKGKSPKEIPIQNVSKTNVRVNTGAMKRFHLRIPEKYLKTASTTSGTPKKTASNPPARMAMVQDVSSPDCDDVANGILSRLKELGPVKDTGFKF